MNLIQQHLFYTNKDLKNHTFINVSTSIPIVTWKLTKNRPYIISNKPLSSCSSYYGNNQRLKFNDVSSCIPIKDIEVFDRLIERLLFTSKITRPSIQDCVTSLLTLMKLSMNYHKNRNLNIDLLLMKKIQMFTLSSPEHRYIHFETLYYEHKYYILIILQQIIQTQRFKL